MLCGSSWPYLVSPSVLMGKVLQGSRPTGKVLLLLNYADSEDSDDSESSTFS